MIRVPVVLGFNPQAVIGSVELDERRLPDSPDFVFAIGFSPPDAATGRCEIREVGLINDSEYVAYLMDGQRHA